MTPLSYASQNNHTEVVSYLAEFAGDADDSDEVAVMLYEYV